MSFLKNFIKTSRYDKPHGIFLLFFPCIWGLYLVNKNIADVFVLCIIFLLGACGMRSLGCIWNDINDRKFDRKVARTKERLIAQGKVKNFHIFIFAFINAIIGVLPLFFIPIKAIFMSLIVIPLVITYPFMKRITWWPQLWLGITFNWGVLVGYTTLSGKFFSIEMLTLYIGCVLWTLGYDTIYGFQDIVDDKKIGLKSTALKFEKNPKIFLLFVYSFSNLFFLYTFSYIKSHPYLVYIIGVIFFILLFKIFKINLLSPKECKRFFIFNSYCGIMITFIILFF